MGSNERVPKKGLFDPSATPALHWSPRPVVAPGVAEIFGLVRPAFPAATQPRVLLAFHKPYGILSQFTPEPGSRWGTLAGFGFPPQVYPLGRLDADSEGLLLLSDERGLNTRLLDPAHGHRREYWAQVEGVPNEDALQRLRRGVVLQDYRTRPGGAVLLTPPPAWPPREPPIRVRKTVPDSWLSLELMEGKNRQVRRMTAAIGHPTLRLIRVRIGQLSLPKLALASGRWRELTPAERQSVFA